MDTRILYQFLDLSKNKRLSITADNFYMSKQSISRNMLLLEEEYNIKLFNRDNGLFILTKSGEKFYEMVKKICIDLDNLENTFNSNELSIASISSDFTYYLKHYHGGNLIKQLKSFASNEKKEDDLIETFLCNDRMFYLGYDCEKLHKKNIYNRYISTDKVSVYVNSNHKWANLNSITLLELLNESLSISTSNAIWFDNFKEYTNLNFDVSILDFLDLYESFIDGNCINLFPSLCNDYPLKGQLGHSIEIVDYKPRTLYLWYHKKNESAIFELFDSFINFS